MRLRTVPFGLIGSVAGQKRKVKRWLLFRRMGFLREKPRLGWPILRRTKVGGWSGTGSGMQIENWPDFWTFLRAGRNDDFRPLFLMHPKSPESSESVIATFGAIVDPLFL